MKVEIQRINPTPEEYEAMYKQAFDGQTPMPHHVFAVMVDGEMMAFASVYEHSWGNLVLQHIGFLNTVMGSKYSIYVKTIDALHGLGYPFIMGIIDSRNIIALMWALRSGFLINGCRQATDGKLYVEVLRRKE